MTIREKILTKLGIDESHSLAMLHLGMMMSAANKPNVHKHDFKTLKKGWKKTDEKTHTTVTGWMGKKKDDGLGNIKSGEHYRSTTYHPAHSSEKGKPDKSIKITTTRNKDVNPHGRHKVVHSDGKVEYYVDKEPQK